MAIKYAKKSNIILFIVFSIIKSLQVVFIANLVKVITNYAVHPKGSLLQVAIVATVGLLLFLFAGIAHEYLSDLIIKDINVEIKQQSSKYLIYQAKQEQKLDTSFFTNDVKQIETSKILSELDAITNLLQFAAAIIAALFGSIVLTIVYLVVSAIPGLVQRIFTKKIEGKSQIWAEQNSTYTNIVKDSELISPTARLYDVEVNIWHRFKRAAVSLEESLFQMNFLRDISNRSVETSAFLFSNILPSILGVILVTRGEISLGILLMIDNLANQFINPVVNFFYDLNDISAANPMWQKFLGTTKRHLTGAWDGIQSALEDPQFRQLNLINVTVKYNQKTVVKNLNLQIKRGEKILLTAPSGWGKSTLLNILTGEQEIASGEFKIDGMNLAGNWQQAHRYFSFIHQTPLLLDESLRFNITLGSNASDGEVLEAIKAAGLDDLVDQIGLYSTIGEEGSRLSGGQRQRVEIARALLRNRPILIADEPTSSLDEGLARRIQGVILNTNKTVIEVAHRVSPAEAKLFDRIINLDELAE